MRLAKLIVLGLVCVLAAASAMSAETRNPEDYFFNLNSGDFKSEADDAKSAGKKALMVMFEQDGCPGCLHMKQNVLNRVDVQNFYRQRFLNFSINTFGAVPIRDFAGRDFTEKSFAQSARITATPTFLFYDLSGAEVARIVGPVKTAEDFMLLGEFVASGAYKTRKFAEYLQSQRKNKGS